MDIESIRAQWQRGHGGYSHVEVWDEAASGYASRPLPTFEDDPFLQFLRDAGALTPEARVLDIGCGAGLYSIAIAPQVAEVVGCDLSPKMVDAARAKAAGEGCTNTRFICGDFANLSAEELGGQFDVVFAHFTPALGSAADFEHMVSLAREWVFVAMPCRRTDPVREEACRLCGIPAHDSGRDESALFSFAMAWLSGHTPEVRHYQDVWLDSYTLADAQALYSDHLVAPDLNPTQKAIVQNYLASIAQDGMVYERITTTPVMMGWRV